MAMPDEAAWREGEGVDIRSDESVKLFGSGEGTEGREGRVDATERGEATGKRAGVGRKGLRGAWTTSRVRHLFAHSPPTASDDARAVTHCHFTPYARLSQRASSTPCRSPATSAAAFRAAAEPPPSLWAAAHAATALPARPLRRAPAAAGELRGGSPINCASSAAFHAAASLAAASGKSAALIRPARSAAAMPLTSRRSTSVCATQALVAEWEARTTGRADARERRRMGDPFGGGGHRSGDERNERGGRDGGQGSGTTGTIGRSDGEGGGERSVEEVRVAVETLWRHSQLLSAICAPHSAPIPRTARPAPPCPLPTPLTGTSVQSPPPLTNHTLTVTISFPLMHLSLTLSLPLLLHERERLPAAAPQGAAWGQPRGSVAAAAPSEPLPTAEPAPKPTAAAAAAETMAAAAAARAEAEAVWARAGEQVGGGEVQRLMAPLSRLMVPLSRLMAPLSRLLLALQGGGRGGTGGAGGAEVMRGDDEVGEEGWDGREGEQDGERRRGGGEEGGEEGEGERAVGWVERVEALRVVRARGRAVRKKRWRATRRAQQTVAWQQWALCMGGSCFSPRSPLSSLLPFPLISSLLADPSPTIPLSSNTPLPTFPLHTPLSHGWPLCGRAGCRGWVGQREEQRQVVEARIDAWRARVMERDAQASMVSGA
ncbi:unnamed protein product, partial [Closterium sp. NIES-65]